MSDGEFDGIFEASGESRPVMSIPHRMFASKKLIREVREVTGLDDDKAREVADWLADKMERFGASGAQPMFDMEGNGPRCSWCGIIWPLCGHHHLSTEVNEEETR